MQPSPWSSILSAPFTRILLTTSLPVDAAIHPPRQSFHCRGPLPSIRNPSTETFPFSRLRRIQTVRLRQRPISPRVVASLDRKRLGTKGARKKMSWTRGVFDEEARRKPLAFAADAVSYGI